jgi:hypothetical protein
MHKLGLVRVARLRDGAVYRPTPALVARTAVSLGDVKPTVR